MKAISRVRLPARRSRPPVSRPIGASSACSMRKARLICGGHGTIWRTSTPRRMGWSVTGSSTSAARMPFSITGVVRPAMCRQPVPLAWRPALAYPAGQEMLFISGTASIVGHRTVHVGDVAGQCRESMANIAAVLDQANRQRRSSAFQLDEMEYRAYVRHAADFTSVSETLRPLIGNANAVYVQADICRHDLLLEIEAFASHALEN